MKEIPLTQGKVALVDDEDYEWLNQWKWHAHRHRNSVWYALRTVNNLNNGVNKSKKVLMHREIMRLKYGDKRQVDHINGNGLDNRKENLRICNNQQNHFNMKKHCDNTSGYKGVSWHKKYKKWSAGIRHNKKRIHIGCFDNKIDAAIAYNKKAKELFGEFVKLNKI